LCLCLCLSSCSSLNTTLIYGSLGGAAVGGVAGHTFSPDKESDVFNTVVGGAIGAFVGAGVAYLLRADDPDNQEMKQMIRRDKRDKDSKRSYQDEDAFKPSEEDFGFQLIKPSQSKSYIVPSEKLPDNLKDKIKKQIITEHIIKERIEKKEGGKTIVYPESKVYEYDYQ
jgi:uncharacterized membrane protein YeaQ/YmgE (transglycosylase-associated protein family)